ncbi:MAG: hypothetical protein KIT33_01060 [Candidatus Kapabacteria bacterium]|nr:hypothetical protein [Ignavibacteriota bacterium]MCW5883537.1 hypothetical protein [Candidatus Kapabacteria bacterium]
MKYLIITILLISVLPVFSQEEFQPWDLDSLDYNELNFEEDFSYQASYGWFPKIVTSKLSYLIYANGGDIWDEAQLKTTPHIAHARLPLIASIPISTDRRKTKKAYSIEDDDNGPATEYGEIGLGIRFKTTDYFFTRVQLAYVFGHSLLGSVDKSKRFLSTDGNIKILEEANLLHLREYGINMNLGMEIPFYGAFASADENTMESHYYLYTGLKTSQILKSRVNQYLQILNVKNEIRYDNGRDTLNLIHNLELPNINLTKFRAEMGLGYRFMFDGFGLGYEITYSYPLTNVINDEFWRQHIVTFNFSINFR